MKSVCSSRPRCTCCGTSETPLWRSGPQGAKSLCNACGVRFKKGKLRYNPESNKFTFLDNSKEELEKPSFSASVSDSCCFSFSKQDESGKSAASSNLRKPGEINPARKRNKSLKSGKSFQRTKSCHQLETKYIECSPDIDSTFQQADYIYLSEQIKPPEDAEENSRKTENSNYSAEKELESNSNHCYRGEIHKVASVPREKAFSAPASPVSNFHLSLYKEIQQNNLQRTDERCTSVMSPKPRYVSPSVFQYVKLIDCLALGTHSRKRSLESCECSSVFDRCMSYSAPFVSPKSPGTPEICVRELDALSIRHNWRNEDTSESGANEGIDKETNEQNYSEEDFIAELNAAILKCNGMYHTDLEDSYVLTPHSNLDERVSFSDVGVEKKMQRNSARANMNLIEDSYSQLLNHLHRDADYNRNIEQLYSSLKREFSSVARPQELFSVYCQNAVKDALNKAVDTSYRPCLETCTTIIEKERSSLGLDEVSIADILTREICQLQKSHMTSKSKELDDNRESARHDTNTKSEKLSNKVVNSVKPTPA